MERVKIGGMMRMSVMQLFTGEAPSRFPQAAKRVGKKRETVKEWMSGTVCLFACGVFVCTGV